MKSAKFTILAIVVTLAVLALGASPGPGQKGGLHKGSSVNIVGDYTVFDVNNISTFVRNNGSFDRNPGTGNAGFEWPKGSGNTAIYASGLWIGGKSSSDGVARVAVAEYDYEFGAGPIINGQSADPTLPRYRMYKIRRGDDATTNPDYADWPVADGAPVDEQGNPLLLGDMTVWCVFNDADVSYHTNMNAQPAGVEVQLTAFGFNRADALGNAIFYKWKVINKGGHMLDTTYITIWSDPDLGDSGDDYDGCDTTLGLGFIYNGDAVDGVYGTPPSAGFDFLQGPLVPGAPTDTARYPDGRMFPGKKLLKMTSYLKYSNDTTPLGNPNTGDEVLNYMRGLDRNGNAIIDPSGHPSPFMFSGDPNSAYGPTNWIENGPPGDRRFMMTAGPFVMAPGDTQEIVAAVIIAQGASNTASVTALKNADALVQTAYDADFKLPPPPAPPIVTYTPYDQALVLSWSDGAQAAARAVDIEKTVTFDPIAAAGAAADPNYRFQGYVVYQVPSLSSTDPRDWKILKTFDLPGNIEPIYDDVFDPSLGYTVSRPVKLGENKGIERTIRITTDAFNGVALDNSKDYYYCVTSYSYGAESVPKTLESSLNVFAARPSKQPGVRYASAYGDTIPGVVKIGSSDGSAMAFVKDPGKVTGHQYRVTFEDVSGQTVWKVTDVTTGEVKLPNETNQAGDDAYPTFDGIQIKVFGARYDLKGFLDVSDAAGPRVPPTQGAFLFNGSEFPTLIPCDPVGAPCDRPTANAGGASWGIHTGDAGLGDPADITYPYFVTRVFRGDNFSRVVPYDFELRFTAAGGKAWFAFTDESIVDVPFELWNIGINTPDDPSDDYRLIPWVYDFNEDGEFGLDGDDHRISGGDNDPETDWIYWYAPHNHSPGQAGYQTEFVDRGTAYDGSDGAGNDHEELMARMVLVDFNAGSVSDPTFPANISQTVPETGQTFRIVSTKPNYPGVDEYLVNTANYVTTKTAENEKTDISLVNVVPNPYYGASAYERNQFGRVVRFTNLPTTATVRIFNLVGDLVRTLRKDGPGTTIDWDLQNENALPVASGMYIAYIDMPGLGTRTLKLAVILSEERLDNF
jgi:hypothetical protein